MYYVKFSWILFDDVENQRKINVCLKLKTVWLIKVKTKLGILVHRDAMNVQYVLLNKLNK